MELRLTSGVAEMNRHFKALFVAAVCIRCTHAFTSVELPSLPDLPVNASQVLDPRLASFSIELAYLPSFGGNKTRPNILTRELMLRLEERTGVGPDLRPGGITV